MMELLLILTYSAICVAVFKIFRIPVNKWTLPTAALGGIFLITGILLRAAPSFDLQRTGRAADRFSGALGSTGTSITRPFTLGMIGVVAK